MPKRLLLFAGALLLAVSPIVAESASEPDIAFLSRTMEVTLLNEGGKYVAVDLKHIPQGGTCRMDENSTIVRMGPGDKPGTTKVRYVAPQLSSGGCPFLSIFDIPDADYEASRAAFLAKKEDAVKRWDQIKKDVGDRWEEIFGKRS